MVPNLKEITFEQMKEEMSKEIDFKADSLLFTFSNDKDLRDVLMAIFLNPVSKWSELKLQEKFKCFSTLERRINSFCISYFTLI